MAKRTGFDRFLQDIEPFFFERSLTYVDVGAYRGEVFAAVLESGLKIREAHLIEPNEQALAVARENTAPLFRGNSLDFYPVAVGSSAGTLQLHAAEAMTKVVASSAGGIESRLFSTREVACITLDSLVEGMTDRRISLLKIDVEGYEVEVLKGAKDLLQEQRVDVLYIEAGMNPEAVQQCYYREIEDFLQAYGYKLFKIYEQRHEWIVDSPLLRRVNLAFFSASFAASNPYRPTVELHKCRKDLEAARREADSRGKRVEALENELREVVKRLDAARQQCVETNRALEEAKDAQQRRSAALTKERNEALTRVAAAEEELRQVNALNESLNRRVSELSRELAESERRAESLQASLSEASEKLLQMQELGARQQKALEDAAEQARAANDRCADLEVQQAAAREELSAKTRELEELAEAFALSQQTISSVFEAIPQIHRRELRARKEATSARSDWAKLQGAPEYQLGKVIVEGTKGLGALFRVPVSLVRQYRRIARGHTPDGVADQRSAEIRFNAKTSTLWLPLTVQPQTVAFSEKPDHELWVTAIARHPTGEIQASIDVARDSSVKLHVGENRAKKRPSRTVRLTVGKPCRLLSTQQWSGDVRFELVRKSGPFCLLLLELRRSDAHATSAQVTRRGQADARSTRAEASSPIVRHDAAASLEQKLWGGYAAYAIPELESLRDDGHAPVDERVLAAWQLARWWYAHENFEGALRCIRLVRSLENGPKQRTILAETQALLRLDRHEEALGVLRAHDGKAVDFAVLESTVIRRVLLANGEALDIAESAQLSKLNDVFRRAGLAPLCKLREDQPLTLANIGCHVEPRTASQSELVSVVVPAYNAESSIDWVLESLTRQTWRNLEIIVVDDCSTDGTCEVVERIARKDSRVKLLRRAENGGAYSTRNIGARAASGEFLMVHDSDDWSHPQQIEIQMEALRANPDRVGVKSHWVRVDENLEAVGAWAPRGTLFDLNFSSLLIRRDTLDSLGLWDEVCVSGDAEFYSRLRAVYADDSVIKVPKKYLLALSLTRPDSLTQSKRTHLRSLFYGLRWNYRDCYLAWHKRLSSSSDGLPFLPNARKRPFPVPVGNVPNRNETAYDLVVVSDFALDSPALDAALDLMITARRSDKAVAVFHWRHYPLEIRDPLQQKLYDACVEHGIDILSPGDHATAATLFVACPTVLQHLIEPRPLISTKEVFLASDFFKGPSCASRAVPLAPDMLRRSTVDAFGAEGEWASVAAVRRHVIQAAGVLRIDRLAAQQ